MRPAVPLYWRCTPTDLVPFFRKPVSSMTSTAVLSPSISCTYLHSTSRNCALSQTARSTRYCIAYGVLSPASSANCHPFLRSTGLSNPRRYACARSRVSDRAKEGPIRSHTFLNRLVHSSSGESNDEGDSTVIGFLLPLLFFPP